MHYFLDVSAGQIVCFQFIAGDVTQTGFMCFNQARHNDIRRYITNTHQE
ncbi:unknown [Bacteroides clarus CAG:160]|nr:unknown [Bacteroides clarus CAG:160]